MELRHELSNMDFTSSRLIWLRMCHRSFPKGTSQRSSQW